MSGEVIHAANSSRRVAFSEAACSAGNGNFGAVTSPVRSCFMSPVGLSAMISYVGLPFSTAVAPMTAPLADGSGLSSTCAKYAAVS